MILCDREIEAALDNALIHIRPRPAEDLWTSTAIDLTLDKVLLRWDPKPPKTGAPPKIRPKEDDFDIMALMDNPAWATKVIIDKEHGYPLTSKGEFVLGFTAQVIYLPHRPRIAARVEGKSSLARLGIGVHVTAPTIHAGFGFKEGVPEKELGSPIQLEIFNLSGLPVYLDIDMPICQLILEEVREVPSKGYTGRFGSQTGFTVSSVRGGRGSKRPKNPGR